MKAKTHCLVGAFSVLLYLSGKCCAPGKEAKRDAFMQRKPSSEQTKVFEAVERKMKVDLIEQTTTTDVHAQRAPGDATATLNQSSFTAVSFDVDVETRNESGDHCNRASTCALNLDHRPGRCSCHSYCHLFGDCCEDAVPSYRSNNSVLLPRTAYSCYTSSSPFTKAVNIITSCPDHYEISAVVKACNQSRNIWMHDASFDSLSTPVTDGSTGLTFGSVYCAICWNANPETSEAWLWNFNCNNKNISQKNYTKTIASFLPNSTSERKKISTFNYLRTTCNSSFVPARKYTAPFTECDPTEVSVCPSIFDPTDELVILCRSAPVRRVYYNKLAYRNVYCMACYHSDYQHLRWSCLPPRDSTSLQSSSAIIVSPSAESCDLNAPFLPVTNKTDDLCSRLSRCVDRDKQSITCSGICPSAIGNEEGTCRALNATSLCSFDEVFDETSIGCSYWSLFIKDKVIVQLNAAVTMCHSCVLALFENYTVVNGSFSVGVNGSNRIYSNILTFAKDGLLSAFMHSPPVSTLSPFENDGTGCSSSTLPWGVPLTILLVSQCCMVVYFALYAASQRLRCFLGEIVLNQSIGFFLGFAFFTFRWITDHSPSVCRPLVILLHYFYTAAFAWTSLFAIEVARAFSPSVNLAQETRFNRKRIAYYIFGWVSPLLLVLLGVAADELALEIRPGYGTWLCFFGGRLGYTVLFAAPMGLWMTIDVVVYVYVIVRIAVVERQTRIARDTRLEKLLLSAKLLLALGLPWGFAIAASFTEDDWIRCAFKIANSLQGTFILFIFGLKRDVIASLKCCKPLAKNFASTRNAVSVIKI